MPYYGDQTNKVKEWISHKTGKYGWVYQKDGRIAGWLVLQIFPQESSLKISSLCVVKKFRNQGIGNQLINYAINEARNKDKNEIWCTVNKKNLLTKKFLLKNGFQISESRRDMYLPGETELILRRKID